MPPVKHYSSSEVNQYELSTRLLSLTENNASYTLTQINGQRIYRKAPHAWTGPEPSRNCEVFIGRIPHDCFEDTLVPLFRRAGELFEFRLMINFSGWNRGYAFAMYTMETEASNAIRMFNNYMIRPSWQLGVCPSINNCRIFISRIPPTTPSAEIVRLLYALTDEVQEVRIRRSIASCAAIVEYKSHRGAAMARKALVAAAGAAWGCGARPAVDWSLPQSPQLLKQYHEVGRWTPEHGVELTRAPEEPPTAVQAHGGAAPSYTLEPWSQARRLRMIHEAQRCAASATATAANEWSNRVPNGMDSLVTSMGTLNLASGMGGCAGMGLEAGERAVWAPMQAARPPPPRDFNPWTARHPLQEFIAITKNDYSSNVILTVAGDNRTGRRLHCERTMRFLVMGMQGLPGRCLCLFVALLTINTGEDLFDFDALYGLSVLFRLFVGRAVIYFLFCVACLVTKRISQDDETRLALLLQKFSREWSLLTSVTWDSVGGAFADAVYGGYVMITFGLILARIFGEVPRGRRILEGFFLGFGMLFFIILGGLELASLDSVPYNLVTNASVLGSLSLVVAALFLIDLMGPRMYFASKPSQTDLPGIIASPKSEKKVSIVTTVNTQNTNLNGHVAQESRDETDVTKTVKDKTQHKAQRPKDLDLEKAKDISPKKEESSLFDSPRHGYLKFDDTFEPELEKSKYGSLRTEIEGGNYVRLSDPLSELHYEQELAKFNENYFRKYLEQVEGKFNVKEKYLPELQTPVFSKVKSGRLRSLYDDLSPNYDINRQKSPTRVKTVPSPTLQQLEDYLKGNKSRRSETPLFPMEPIEERDGADLDRASGTPTDPGFVQYAAEKWPDKKNLRTPRHSPT